MAMELALVVSVLLSAVTIPVLVWRVCASNDVLVRELSNRAMAHTALSVREKSPEDKLEPLVPEDFQPRQTPSRGRGIPWSKPGED